MEVRGIKQKKAKLRALKLRLAALRKRKREEQDYRSRWLRGARECGPGWAVRHIGPMPQDMETSFLLAAAQEPGQLSVAESSKEFGQTSPGIGTGGKS